jgi:lipopolysaccharide/colanic/teichoic acid biosynthesis glycosyltransferase
MVRQSWFIEHMSTTSSQSMYDVAKRLVDVVFALVAGIISLIFYPFTILAIKLDDHGVVFSYQKRVGQFNKIVNIAKFRTMTVANDDGKWGSSENKVTRVGSFLRKTRIDELPQLWNVLRGDVSLIGPRPEFPEPVKKYSEEIPYYNFRHSIKPGLSGWAQIYGEHAHHGIGLAETANKLSYDLYYIKHRSFLLDIKILLRTIKTLITFVGR